MIILLTLQPTYTFYFLFAAGNVNGVGVVPLPDPKLAVWNALLPAAPKPPVLPNALVLPLVPAAAVKDDANPPPMPLPKVDLVVCCWSLFVEAPNAVPNLAVVTATGGVAVAAPPAEKGVPPICAR